MEQHLKFYGSNNIQLVSAIATKMYYYHKKLFNVSHYQMNQFNL